MFLFGKTSYGNDHLKKESEEKIEEARNCWLCDYPINAEEDRYTIKEDIIATLQENIKDQQIIVAN